MIAAGCSPGVGDVASCAPPWPATTKPWIVATLLVDDGTAGAYLMTYTSDSCHELIPSVSFMSGHLLEMLCVNVESGRWVPRRITEVLSGRVGDSDVVVLRDEAGSLFCPEIPGCPAAAVQELKQVRTVGYPNPAPNLQVPTSVVGRASAHDVPA